VSQRVYVPLTSSGLADLVAVRVLPPATGHAVTDAVRRQWPDADDEELEYAALAAAAEASWLARGAGDRPRRHVLAVDVTRAEPAAEDDPSGVRLPEPTSWAAIAALHLDVEDVTDPAPGEGDLAWFATQEIPDLA